MTTQGAIVVVHLDFTNNPDQLPEAIRLFQAALEEHRAELGNTHVIYDRQSPIFDVVLDQPTHNLALIDSVMDTTARAVGYTMHINGYDFGTRVPSVVYTTHPEICPPQSSN